MNKLDELESPDKMVYTCVFYSIQFHKKRVAGKIIKMAMVKFYKQLLATTMEFLVVLILSSVRLLIMPEYLNFSIVSNPLLIKICQY